MRKEDRVAAARQQEGDRNDRTQKPEPREHEKLKGSASPEPAKPPRPGGRLPLPE